MLEVMDTVPATASKLDAARDSVFQAWESRAKPDWAERTPMFEKNEDYVGYGVRAADLEAPGLLKAGNAGWRWPARY